MSLTTSNFSESINYELDLPPDWKIHNVFHVSLLKPCPVGATFDDSLYFRPGPISGTTDKYIVERLLDKRTVGSENQRWECLIHWRGYPAYEATWEPESNLTGSEVQKWKTLLTTSCEGHSNVRRRGWYR